MADAHPNSGDPAVDQPGMAKKKKAKAPRKPRAECTPEEIAKLDAESAKRRNWRAAVKDNAAARKFAVERDAMEAARRKIGVEEKEAIVNKARALLMLGICRPAGFWVVGLASTGSSVARSPHCQSPTSRTTAVSPGYPLPRNDARTRFLWSPDRRSGVRRDAKKASTTAVCGHHAVHRVLFDEMSTPPVDNNYDQFMEDVIYNGGHVPAYDPDETQSQDGRAQFVADEEADDRADYDHGDSWHGDDDIYCEGDGDEDEVNDIDISGEPLFIDELTQRAEAQKKKKSIRTGSYTQDEDKLICNSWMEISQDPRTGAQQKGLVFWTRVHKTFHERKMFEPYQITSDRGITSIQKRWLFIQQECNKYCAALESIEAWPVSGLGIGDMAFQSLEAFKARHNDKPFTLMHCWMIINDSPKFKDQYRELQRKRGKKTTKFIGGGDGEALKRPRGKTNSKVDDIRDAASMALNETLHGMMSQKDMRDEKKRQSKDEQRRQYLELQRKKLEMEEAAKKRKIDLEEATRQRQLDIEAANVEARKRQLDIGATNDATKAKEVALAIMSVDLTKMSEKTRS
ncbi:putative DBINO protein [Hordeum vulgare]|nr:putative DBINO protein [Hordeum vulgare]